jgi:hypothetical protein
MAKPSFGILLAVILALCTNTLLWGDRPEAEEPTLEEQFAQALRAKGPEYVSIRDAIVEEGSGAVAFLSQRLADADWHVRVLAEAMLLRISDPQRCRYYGELLLVPTVRAGWMRGGPVPTLAAAARGVVPPGYRYVVGARRMRARVPLVSGPLQEASALPFLAELLMKASLTQPLFVTPPLPEDEPGRVYTVEEVADMFNVTVETARYWVGWGITRKNLDRFVRYCLPPAGRGGPSPRLARCYAALLLGNSKDPLAVEALTEILYSDEPTLLRECAARGLGMSKSAHAIPPLLTALSDEADQVRAAAASALGEALEGEGGPEAVLQALGAVAEADLWSTARREAQRALQRIRPPLAQTQ